MATFPKVVSVPGKKKKRILYLFLHSLLIWASSTPISNRGEGR